MDVRCEKCQTEYEFDDSRITEAGVTVKCTTCGHVFKVKKKALVFAVPVKETDAAEAAPPVAPAAPSAAAASQSGADKQREWKVRQANGNVFNFKELTTLQKWIVERKVSRDDEISLTGESWKRLGNIAELASFFQVVEEAQKAAQLSALQSGGYLGYSPPSPSGPYPMPTVPSPQPAPVTLVTPAPVMAPQQPPLQPVPQPLPQPVAPPIEVAPPPVSSSKNQTMTFGQTPAPSTPVAPPPSPRRQVMSAQRRAHDEDEDELEAAGLKKKSGGAGTFLVVLLLLAVLGGGGYFGYFHYWLPMEQQKADAEKAEQDRRAKEEQERLAAVASEKEKERLAAVLDAGAPEIDAGVAVAPEVDAGAPVVDAGTPVVKKEPVRDFDWYIAQGDRLRDRERAEAALDMYGKAEELQPDRAEALAGKGLALLDMGHKAPAEAAFQSALKSNPRYGVAIMGLAELYKDMGRKADAIKWYERYLDVLPNGPEAPVATEAIRRLKSE